MKKELRYYQQEAYDAVFENLKKGVKNQMVVLATGAGKTFTAAKIINDFEKKLWITHTEELISQSGIALLSEYFPQYKDKLKGIIDTHGGLNEYLHAVRNNPMFHDMADNEIMSKVGIIKAEAFNLSTDITVASIQTLHRRLDRIPSNIFDVVVTDECHYAASNTWSKTINHFNPKLNLGLTATPHRLDGLALSNLYDKITYEYSIEKGINDNFLCELDAIKIKTNVSLENVKTTGGDLNQGDLQLVNCDSRNNLIVDSYLKYANGRQAIGFAVNVDHAMEMSRLFNQKGIFSDFVVGDQLLTTDRQGTIANFKNGNIQVIWNVMVLTAGFDHPDTGCIITACPTKSLTKFLQQVGRGTRLKSESFVKKFKQDCIILDIVDMTSKHSLVNTWTLDAGKPPEKRVFITKEKKQILIDERQKNLAKILGTSTKDEKVSLFKLPNTSISNSARMLEPATTSQLEWVARLGYDTKNIEYTKAMCSEIISQVSASDKQIGFLKWKGYDVSNGVTVTQAKKAFAEIEQREVEAKMKAMANTKVTVVKSNPFNDLF